MQYATWERDRILHRTVELLRAEDPEKFDLFDTVPIRSPCLGDPGRRARTYSPEYDEEDKKAMLWSCRYKDLVPLYFLA